MNARQNFNVHNIDTSLNEIILTLYFPMTVGEVLLWTTLTMFNIVFEEQILFLAIFILQNQHQKRCENNNVSCSKQSNANKWPLSQESTDGYGETNCGNAVTTSTRTQLLLPEF